MQLQNGRFVLLTECMHGIYIESVMNEMITSTQERSARETPEMTGGALQRITRRTEEHQAIRLQHQTILVLIDRIDLLT